MPPHLIEATATPHRWAMLPRVDPHSISDGSRFNLQLISLLSSGGVGPLPSGRSEVDLNSIWSRSSCSDLEVSAFCPRVALESLSSGSLVDHVAQFGGVQPSARGRRSLVDHVAELRGGQSSAHGRVVLDLLRSALRLRPHARVPLRGPGLAAGAEHGA